MIYDIHVHTNVVDGRYSPRQVVEHAKKIGLNGIAIVDHDEVRGNIEARKYAGKDFTIVPGLEFSTTQGHILCLGSTDVPEEYLGAMFKKENYRSPGEIVDLIHDIGGIAIAAHPYDRVRSAVGDLVYRLPFDAIEVVNGHTLSNTKDPAKAADELKLPKVGGSDAHSLHEIGNICVEAEGGDIVEAIRSNHVRIVRKGRLSLLAGFLRSGILKSYFGLEKY